MSFTINLHLFYVDGKSCLRIYICNYILWYYPGYVLLLQLTFISPPTRQVFISDEYPKGLVLFRHQHCPTSPSWAITRATRMYSCHCSTVLMACIVLSRSSTSWARSSWTTSATCHHSFNKSYGVTFYMHFFNAALGHPHNLAVLAPYIFGRHWIPWQTYGIYGQPMQPILAYNNSFMNTKVSC